jgi:hypothetical protein
VQVCVTGVEVDCKLTVISCDSHSNGEDSLGEVVDVTEGRPRMFSAGDEGQKLVYARETAYRIEQAMVVEQEIPELEGEERHHSA